MPWTADDADEHKKGLTPAQKKKWASIANGVLKDCQSKGGKDCEGKAIRIANSSFTEEIKEMVMKKETQKIPASALHFIDHDAFAKVNANEEKKPKLEMIAYSGGVIKGHFWWGDLAIDLAGMKFSKKKFPILEAHDTERKIAFSGKPIVEKNVLKIDPETVEFVDTPYAQEFIKLSQQGFPYESSIYAIPQAIERLEEGTDAEVNGYKLKGPATIWRQCQFKEASVCVFGYDANTRSTAFSQSELELDVEVTQLQLTEEKPKEKEVKKTMDLEQLKKENPELIVKLTEEITVSLKEKFSKEKQDMENKFNTEKSELQKRVMELEKKDAIRAENELKSRAERIWKTKLSESAIPERLFDKVSQHVSYTKFVKDGILDEKAFTDAIAGEIKDWEDRGVTSSSVQGVGFAKKDDLVDKNLKLHQEDVDKSVDFLYSLSGQEVKK